MPPTARLLPPPLPLSIISLPLGNSTEFFRVSLLFSDVDSSPMFGNALEFLNVQQSRLSNTNADQINLPLCHSVTFRGLFIILLLILSTKGLLRAKLLRACCVRSTWPALRLCILLIIFFLVEEAREIKFIFFLFFLALFSFLSLLVAPLYQFLFAGIALFLQLLELFCKFLPFLEQLEVHVIRSVGNIGIRVAFELLDLIHKFKFNLLLIFNEGLNFK